MELKIDCIRTCEEQDVFVVEVTGTNPNKLYPQYGIDNWRFKVAIPGTDDESIDVISDRAKAVVRRLARGISAEHPPNV